MNKRLYFDTDNNGICNSDIMFIEKLGNGWGKPYSLGSVINTTEIQAPATSNSAGTVYYRSTKRNTGPFYIFSSKFKKGNYLQPDNLPDCINSVTAQHWTPFIAPDDS